MAKFTSYFVSWVLLATCWHTTTGMPVQCLTRPTGAVDTCTLRTLALLQNIRGLLADATLFKGVRCSEREAEMNPNTETVAVCTPFLAKNSSCFIPTEKAASFNESLCLGNIVKDLEHYSAFLLSYLKTRLRMNHTNDEKMLRPTIELIQTLMKDCSLKPVPMEAVAKEWEDEPFDRRMRLCKVTRGFHLRTVTINRAIGYIASGDHRR